MRLKYIWAMTIPILLIGNLVSCPKNSNSTSGGCYSNTPEMPMSPISPSSAILVKTDSHYGSVITDGSENALYIFSPDANGNSACSAGCLATWMANPALPAIMSASDFAFITRTDGTQNVPSALDKSVFSSNTVFGKPRLTYNGWPVFRFGPDSLAMGITKGINVPTPGVWPLMDEVSVLAS